ncbi:MAG: LamG-like jellyroll fold domain-containing protein [Verrucomicrobiota bacterium]
MKITKQQVLRLSVVGLLLGSLSAPAAIIHRYSFNEPTGATTVSDSVGGANGVLAGGQNSNPAAFDGAGQLVLPGGGSSSDAANLIAGYVDLPNHLINGLTNMTIETWVTLNGNSTWQRIMDFGVDGTGVEGTSGGNGNYIFISSPAPTNLRYAIREQVTGNEFTQCTANSPLGLFQEVCVTATYDNVGNVARLYVNGALVSTDDAPTPLSQINDINNWLGRSQWGDPMFNGSYNEFRIYNTALDSVSVAASYFSGVTNVSTDPISLGGIQSVSLVASPTIITVQDTLQTTATADFLNIAGVSLAGVPGVTYLSSNPSVLTVSTNGLVTAVSAGIANVTASYLAKPSPPLPFTVNPRLAGVVAGALEVDLRATDLATCCCAT